MFKQSVEFSNMKNGTNYSQLDLAKHLEKKGLGSLSPIQQMFSKFNNGKQKGINLSVLHESANFLNISADTMLDFFKEVQKK